MEIDLGRHEAAYLTDPRSLVEERTARMTEAQRKAVAVALAGAGSNLRRAATLVKSAAESLDAGDELRTKLDGVHDEIEGWGATVERLEEDPAAAI